MRLLVTGGAGYIGAHLVVELLEAGHDVVVVDDLSSGHQAALERAQVLTGCPVDLYVGDVADAAIMSRALRGVEAVFHLAASKQVGESMERPELYFRNNLGGMSQLLESMQAAGVRRIVYSSSAAVYGAHEPVPIREDAPLRPSSPYGFSKVMGEQLLDWMVRQRGWSAVSLRYFNPVGAHRSGQLGEPFAQAASLVPRVLKAAAQADGPLTIFGTDYDTPDGTCLRDYIHITDLAQAHLAAIEALSNPGHHVFNVGTGRPYSVREVLAACQRATGTAVPFQEGDRRDGDVPVSVADPARFQAAVGFCATRSLDEMVTSAWRWWLENPQGYASPVPAQKSPWGISSPARYAALSR